METHQAHPSEKFYVKIAIWLGIVTAVEIMISYVDIADWLAILSLVVLSLIKFAAVVAFFMHLKYDDRMLRKPFVGGLVLALVVYTVVLLAFTLHKGGA